MNPERRPLDAVFSWRRLRGWILDGSPDARGALRVCGQSQRGRLHLRRRDSEDLQDGIALACPGHGVRHADGQPAQGDHGPDERRVAHLDENRIAPAGIGQEQRRDGQERKVARHGPVGSGMTHSLSSRAGRSKASEACHRLHFPGRNGSDSVITALRNWHCHCHSIPANYAVGR